jgi:hypothetical protein
VLSAQPGDPASRIRLVAIDLDGTLLNDSKQVSDRTADALRCLPAQGVRTVIASARPPRSVRHIYQKLGLDTWTINYNGALIWDEVAKRVVFHQPMECDVVREIIDRARGVFEQVLVGCEVLDRWFTDRVEQTYTTETGRLFRPDGVMPLAQFCNQPITKLLLLGDPQLLRGLEPIFYDYPQVIAVRADPELIQVMDRRASKAAALKLVAEHYGVPMEQVMAIGDAANDVPMLEAAGIAVAVDNAHPLVKSVADWVAPSNNDHGVHAALVRYGLCT